MLQNVSSPVRHAAQAAAPAAGPAANPRADARPWARAAGAPAPVDGVVIPQMPRARATQMLAPLSLGERHQVVQLAPRLLPRHRQQPGYNSLVPSHGVGPSSGTRYSFTACPMDRPDSAGRSYSVDSFLDNAFRSGTRTTVSLSTQGDMRHSEYYKQNKAGGLYSVQSSGRPSFTTMVRDARGQPVTASIFENQVRNNHTGEVRPMKMVHINGWRDQTALSSDSQLSLIGQLKDHLNNHDMANMAIHCSEGQNRTGCFATSLESLAAVTAHRPPNTAAHLDWFRQTRVADAVPLPSQLTQLAENEVRMNRLAAPPAGHLHGGRGAQQAWQAWQGAHGGHGAHAYWGRGVRH
jgi:hypothetical protein